MLMLFRLRRIASHLGERFGVEVNLSREQHQGQQKRMCGAIHHHHHHRTFVAVHPCHPIVVMKSKDQSHCKDLPAEVASILDREAPHLLQEEVEVVEQAPLLYQDLPIHARDDRPRNIVIHRILYQDLLLYVGGDPCLKVVTQVVFILDRGLPPRVGGGSEDPSRRHLHATAQGEAGDYILDREHLPLGG